MSPASPTVDSKVAMALRNQAGIDAPKVSMFPTMLPNSVVTYQTSARTLINTSYWKGTSKTGALVRTKPTTLSGIAATKMATTAPSLYYRLFLTTLDDHSLARRVTAVPVS